MSAVKDLLVKARALIEDPVNWIQEEWESVNAAGEACYCADGALLAAERIDYKSVHPRESRAYRDAFSKLNESTEILTLGRFTGFMRYNDSLRTTHSDVLAVFDHAISRA